MSEASEASFENRMDLSEVKATVEKIKIQIKKLLVGQDNM